MGRLEGTTKRRLMQYVNQYSDATRGLNESELIGQVPHHYRAEVLCQMHRELCTVSPLLGKLGNACKAALLLNIAEEVVLSGDELIREGDMGLRFYLLQYGELQV